MTDDVMDIYLVGGAVRDQLLGLPVKERDYVVVGSSPEELSAQGFIPVGRDFPVFLHPNTKEEYALARTERKTTRGYKGFSFRTDPNISLEEDLRRRDLTINAMAQASDGLLIDPYGGQNDLERRLLRHVSPAFVEDPVRVLRLARFSAQFKHLDFHIAPETLALATALQRSGELSALTPERVWKETQKALLETHADEYFKSLRACGGLAILFPELEALFGIPSQIAAQHFMDSGTHALLCLNNACRSNTSPEVRFAALCHSLGKACLPPSSWPELSGYPDATLAPLQNVCSRYKMGQSYRDVAFLTAKYHRVIQRGRALKASEVLDLLAATDSLRRPERFLATVQAAEACLIDAQQAPHLVDFFQPLIDAVRTTKLTDTQLKHSVSSLKEAMYNARLEAITRILKP